MNIDFEKQERDLRLEAMIAEHVNKYREHRRATSISTTSQPSKKTEKRAVRKESRNQIFREGQGVRFRKRCKHGSGEFGAVARLWKSPMTECDERRGKTPHERKLHRIAMQKQVRITRHEAFKVTW